jgi:hypothetical protein
MKRCALHRHERLIGSGGEPRIVLESPEMGLGQNRGNPVAKNIGFGASRIDHQNRNLFIVLGSNAGERLLEPPTGVMGHDEDHDGRGHHLLVGCEEGIIWPREGLRDGPREGLGEGLGGGFLNSHDSWRGYRSHGSNSATSDYDPPMATDPLDDLSQASKDVAHIGIGLAVLAFQKFQVQRRSLERAFRESPTDPQDRMRQWIRNATDRC